MKTLKQFLNTENLTEVFDLPGKKTARKVDISIVEVKETGSVRTSTLQAVDGKSLAVLGVLPHNYEFKPKTKQDRDKLLDWLKTLQY